MLGRGGRQPTNAHYSFEWFFFKYRLESTGAESQSFLEEKLGFDLEAEYLIEGVIGFIHKNRHKKDNDPECLSIPKSRLGTS